MEKLSLKEKIGQMLIVGLESNKKEEIEKLEKEFAGNGRVLIRPSGTEPLIRVMIEGENQEYIKEKAERLAKLIEKKLN